MGELISVIVPVYKVPEHLLRQSIESIMRQTYTDIEIILIDDGTPDNGGVVCDEYGKLDSRINVIHTTNGGVSRARNLGLDVARGEYVLFVDSDDYIEYWAIHELYQAIVQNSVDCAICGVKKIEEESILASKSGRRTNRTVVINRDEAIKKLCYMEEPFEGYELGAVWGCLYKRTSIEGIRFNTNIVIGEDFEFKFKTFLKADSVICIESPGYNYVIRSQSVMRNGFDIKKINSVKELSYLLDDPCYRKYHEAIVARIVNIAIVVLLTVPTTNEYRKEKKYLEKMIKNNRLQVIRNKNARSKVKYSLLLTYFGFGCLETVYSFLKRLGDR